MALALTVFNTLFDASFYTALAFGIILSVVHYASQDMLYHARHYKNQLLSFAAGISLSYIFIGLFPELLSGVFLEGDTIFLFVLVGFALFHLVEKYIYLHATRKKLFRELVLEDTVIAALYHIIAGIVLYEFLFIGLKYGLLFFIPLLVHTSVSALPVGVSPHRLIFTLLALSSLFGVIIGIIFHSIIPVTLFYSLLGFIIGVLLFTTTRHALPAGRHGSTVMFVAGLLVNIFIIEIIQRLLV